MGTSASYNGLKKSPGWSSISSTVTKACDNVNADAPKRAYIKHARFVLENRTGQHGGRSGVGSAGTNAAKGLRSVFAKVRVAGLSNTLASLGFKLDANTKTSDVINFLLEHCCGPAATLDEVAAKQAEKALLEEICLDADTFEDLQEHFQSTLDEFTDTEILVKYFTYYLFEHMSQRFYEKLVKKKGHENAGKLFVDIKEYIKECVIDIARNDNLRTINWSNNNGRNIEEGIFNETLEAFGSYEY